jgi:hypothetical protein
MFYIDFNVVIGKRNQMYRDGAAMGNTSNCTFTEYIAHSSILKGDGAIGMDTYTT